MVLGEEFAVLGDWFYIHFLENPGIAFGGKIDHPFWKPALSIFRVIAIGLIIWYVDKLRKKRLPKGFLVCLLFILAGAIGNVLDSLFYGLLFGDSLYQTALFLPEGGGYAPFLYGKVVDMFYFPIFEIESLPEWIPFRGGTRFMFFAHVFNFADSFIFTGVVAILLFYRRVFDKL